MYSTYIKGNVVQQKDKTISIEDYDKTIDGIIKLGGVEQ
jgi:hypothetical protein